MPRSDLRRPQLTHRSVYIAGTGTLAEDIAEFAVAAGFSVAGRVELIDRTRIGTLIDGSRVIGPEERPPDGPPVAVIAVAGDRRIPSRLCGRRDRRSAFRPHLARGPSRIRTHRAAIGNIDSSNRHRIETRIKNFWSDFRLTRIEATQKEVTHGQ